MALTTVPLQRIAAAAHDPIGAGAGMATRAPLLVEGVGRSLLTGSTVGGTRPLLAAGRWSGRWAAALRPALALVQDRAGVGATLLLTIYGRLQLDGG